jgi:hypothetical protein
MTPEERFTAAFYQFFDELAALKKIRAAAPPARLAAVDRLKAMMAEAARTDRVA